MGGEREVEEHVTPRKEAQASLNQMVETYGVGAREMEEASWTTFPDFPHLGDEVTGTETLSPSVRSTCSLHTPVLHQVGAAYTGVARQSPLSLKPSALREETG